MIIANKSDQFHHRLSQKVGAMRDNLKTAPASASYKAAKAETEVAVPTADKGVLAPVPQLRSSKASSARSPYHG